MFYRNIKKSATGWILIHIAWLHTNKHTYIQTTACLLVLTKVLIKHLVPEIVFTTCKSFFVRTVEWLIGKAAILQHTPMLGAFCYHVWCCTINELCFETDELTFKAAIYIFHFVFFLLNYINLISCHNNKVTLRLSLRQTNR